MSGALKEDVVGRLLAVVWRFKFLDYAWSRLFDRQLKKFVEISRLSTMPETADMLWEEICVRHIKELMTIRKYPDGVIYEFDSLDELRQFDPAFIENIDSEILTTLSRCFIARRRISTVLQKQDSYHLSAHFIVDMVM